MPSYIEGRKVVLQALREELVGPSPQGKEIDCTQTISFDDIQQSYGPWCQQGSGEDILCAIRLANGMGLGYSIPWKCHQMMKPSKTRIF